MVTDKILKAVLKVVQDVPYAVLYFEELSKFHSIRPNIDIVRRRREISKRHNLNLNSKSAIEFFSCLERCGFGHLNLDQGRNKANDSFTWTEQRFSPVELGFEAYKALRKSDGTKMKNDISTISVASSTVVCRLSSGKIIRLTTKEVDELKEFINNL